MTQNYLFDLCWNLFWLHLEDDKLGCGCSNEDKPFIGEKARDNVIESFLHFDELGLLLTWLVKLVQQQAVLRLLIDGLRGHKSGAVL